MQNVDWGYVIGVVFTGLVVVFLVLIALVLLLNFMGKIVTSIEKSRNKNINSEQQIIKSIDTPKIITKQKNDNAIIAAITAAVTVMMTKDNKAPPFIVKSIKKKSIKSFAWGEASIYENTRPF